MTTKKAVKNEEKGMKEGRQSRKYFWAGVKEQRRVRLRRAHSIKKHKSQVGQDVKR